MSPQLSFTVTPLASLSSVLQNFLATCITTPIRSLMLMNDRMFHRIFRAYSPKLHILHISRDPIHVSSERRAELIQSLDKWHFEPHKLPEHEVLYCSLAIFEALFRLDGIFDMVPVSIGAWECPPPHVLSIDPSFTTQIRSGICLSTCDTSIVTRIRITTLTTPLMYSRPFTCSSILLAGFLLPRFFSSPIFARGNPNRPRESPL